MDFALLRPAFEQLPELVGLGPMSIRLDGNWIEYEGCPDLAQFEGLLHSPVLDAWIAQRDKSRRTVYTELMLLASGLSPRPKGEASAFAERFYIHVAPVLAPLLASVFVDEPVIERYRVLESVVPTQLRPRIQSQVFSCPFTSAWAREDLGLTRQKRIVDTWTGSAYVAEMHQSSIDSLAESRVDFLLRMAQTGVDDLMAHELWVIHVIVQCSEELHYLWGSLATLVSSVVSIAAAAGAPFYPDATRE